MIVDLGVPCSSQGGGTNIINDLRQIRLSSQTAGCTPVAHRGVASCRQPPFWRPRNGLDARRNDGTLMATCQAPTPTALDVDHQPSDRVRAPPCQDNEPTRVFATDRTATDCAPSISAWRSPIISVELPRGGERTMPRRGMWQRDRPSSRRCGRGQAKRPRDKPTR